MAEQKSKDILKAEALIAKNRAAWDAIKQSTRDYEEKYWNNNKDYLQAQGYSYTKNPESLWGGVWVKSYKPTQKNFKQDEKESRKLTSKSVDNPIINMEEEAAFETVNTPITTTKPLQSNVITKNDVVMSLDEFRNHKNFRKSYVTTPNASITIEGKTYPIMVSTGTYNPGSKDLYNDHTYAYDPKTGLVRAVDESFIGAPNQRWKSGSSWIDWNKSLGITYKHGGTMNKLKYFQQGGAAPQQDIKAQVTALVQAAMQGNEKATQTVNRIMEAAKAGDQKAVQLAQMIQQVSKQMQGQATAAKWGTKLAYIKSLKYAKGGSACPACQQGGFVKTHPVKNVVKNPTKKVEEKACGGKTKKHYFGGWL